MNCPKCKHNQLKTTRTQSWLDDEVIRTRECKRCGFPFRTTETIDKESDYERRAVEYEETA